jgi:hypothetical protein
MTEAYYFGCTLAKEIEFFAYPRTVVLSAY